MGIDEIGNSTPTVFLGLFHLLSLLLLRCEFVWCDWFIVYCDWMCVLQRGGFIFNIQYLLSTFVSCHFLMGFEEEKWIQILKRIQPGYFSSLNLEF